MGKHSLLNPERQKRIVDALVTGVTYEVAAAYAGIAESTLHDWRARGRRYRDFLDNGGEGTDQLADKLWRKADALWNNHDRQGAYAVLAKLDAHTDRSSELKYLQLFDACEDATARVEMQLSGIVRKAAADGDWKAAIAMLKSRWPERWSERRVGTLEPVDTEAEIARKQALAMDVLELVKQRRASSGNGSG
jgi:hypothetical protein